LLRLGAEMSVGHVRQRASGAWTYVVDLPAVQPGKRRQEWRGGFRSKTAATQAMIKRLGDLGDGTAVATQCKTLGQLIERYVEHINDRLALGEMSPVTVSTYIRDLNRVLAILGAKAKLPLSPLVVQCLFDKQLHASLGKQSVYGVFRVLRRCMKMGVRWQLISVNVCDLIEPPRKPRGKQVVAYTVEQVQAVLASATTLWLKLFIRLGLATGMRRSELLGLRWTEIDLETGEFKVGVRTIVQLMTGEIVEREEAKTAAGDRNLVLGPHVLGLLRQHKAEQAKARLAAGPGYQDNGLIFARADGTRMRPDSVTGAFCDARKRVGLTKGGPHVLRHTAATLLLNAAEGDQAEAVGNAAEILGHADGGVLALKTYVHGTPEGVRKGMAKLDTIVSGLS
jgi:integrase